MTALRTASFPSPGGAWRYWALLFSCPSLLVGVKQLGQCFWDGGQGKGAAGGVWDAVLFCADWVGLSRVVVLEDSAVCLLRLCWDEEVRDRDGCRRTTSSS